MKSFQIRKWQDNYAEDCSKSKVKKKDENLVNAILEYANQLAEINEKCTPSEVTKVQLLNQFIPEKYFEHRYVLKIWFIKIPITIRRTYEWLK